MYFTTTVVIRLKLVSLQMDKQPTCNDVQRCPVVIRLKLVSLQMDKQLLYPANLSVLSCDSLKISIFANG